MSKTHDMLAGANEKLVEAKTKLAAKRAAKGLGVGGATNSERLPSGQRLVDSETDFPILDLGIQPKIPLSQFTLEFFGACDNPTTLDWAAFEALGMVDLVTDFHCVTTWSTYDMPWRGVRLTKVLEVAKPQQTCTHIMFHSSDGYTTNVPLEDCLQSDCLLATHWNGAPLEARHGGPVRGMIPHLYGWKSAKWVSKIEFMNADRRGFWEVRGYHNYGDPWREERYSSQE